MNPPSHLLTLAAVVLTLLACERSPKPVPVDTTATPPAVPVDSPAPRVRQQSPWDSATGPVLLVRSDSLSRAWVVFPQYADTSLPDTVQFSDEAVRDVVVEVFSRAGRAGQARVTGMTGKRWVAPGATAWPVATLKPVSGPSAFPPTWTVGFLRGRVQPIPLDSIESLPPADSARLAAEVTRLASALPNDTASAFRGIPFAVRTAYQFSPAPGVSALVADVERKVNVEANPLIEHILLVAERDDSAPEGRYRTAYSERTSGKEERVESTSVLAAVRAGVSPRPVLVLERQGYESTAYALLERVAPARWRIRWTSVHTES